MFDIGASELLVIAIVAIIVIGPKELPLAMRTAGRWIAKVRRVSAHFRTGFDAMVREAELEEMDREWKAKNERIMAQHPQQNGKADSAGPEMSGEMEPLPEAGAEAASKKAAAKDPSAEVAATKDEPPLPFDKSADGS